MGDLKNVPFSFKLRFKAYLYYCRRHCIGGVFLYINVEFENTRTDPSRCIYC